MTALMKTLECMCGTTTRLLRHGSSGAIRSTSSFSTSSRKEKTMDYKLLVVGGGTGGCATASMFSRQLGKGKVAVLEPNDKHFYQPLWTLVGGGLKPYHESWKPMGEVLPSDCDWIKDSAMEFHPEKNTVTTGSGDEIKYEFLVVAMGLQLNFNAVKGLEEALKHDPKVCSNYSNKTVIKTRPALEKFEQGNAIFTFPASPIKCAGAPQKIMYIAEEYFRDSGKREKANVIYNTSLGVIFGVKKYAEVLMEIVKQRNIQLNLRTNLIEVRHEKNEAVFEHLDTKEQTIFPYEVLHVTPPMSTPDPLRNSLLVDETGYLTVTRETLLHTKYPNVFGIGDNTSVPTAKTAAAVASQTRVLNANLSAAMAGRTTDLLKYDGYTSCPLVTGKNSVVMAEFDWDLQPLETFPFNQGKEMKSMYFVKAEVLPSVYWKLMTRGYWHGPKMVRKMMHLGMSR